MATPILRVPIDDEAFKKFLATFQKYQEQLDQQPEMWAAATDGVEAMAVAGAAMAATMAEQLDSAKRLTEEEKRQADARKRADKDQADRDGQAADRRRKAIDDVKEYAKGIGDTVLSAAKWATIGGGAALATGALGFWGLDRFVSGIGEERRLAGGLNVTTGQRQALSLNMQRYFDVNSALGWTANAQQDPSEWWKFTSLGIGGDPRKRDTADLTLQVATAAGRIFKEIGGNLLTAKARGLLDIGLSVEDLRRMGADPVLLAGSAGQARRDWAPGGAFYLDPKVSQMWQTFVINLGRAGGALETSLIRDLSKFDQNGGLDKVTKAFERMGQTVLSSIDWDKLANGIDKFANYVGDKKFQTNFQTFVTDVGLVADKMVEALKALGVIPETPAERLAAAQRGRNQALEGGLLPLASLLAGGPLALLGMLLGGQALTTFTPFGGPGVMGGSAGGLTPGFMTNPVLAAAQAAANVMTGGPGGPMGNSLSQRVGAIGSNLMRDLGLGSGQVGGILSSADAESGIQPILESLSLAAGHRQDRGWFQWSGQNGRRNEFEAWSRAHGLDPASDAANYGFFVYDMKTHFSGLLERMRHESPQVAAADFFQTYEAGGSRALMRYAGGHVKNTLRFQHAIDVHVSNIGVSTQTAVHAASR